MTLVFITIELAMQPWCSLPGSQAAVQREAEKYRGIAEIFSLRCPRNGQANKPYRFASVTLATGRLNKRLGRRQRLFSLARIPANKVARCPQAPRLNAQESSGMAASGTVVIVDLAT